MNYFFRIVLTAALLALWAAGCHACLSGVRYAPVGGIALFGKDTPTYGTGLAEDMAFRTAAIEASRSIEPGVQPGPDTSSRFASRRVTAGSASRIPVALARFPKSSESGIHGLIQTFKKTPQASFRPRGYYVVELRHLII
ncbi:MAG: hypothetical protein LUE10_02415 [Alistipes sp.]|nr:hypothetical protein [Alistipes sp.]